METTTAYIAFGSNLGDRHATLAGAYAALTGDPAIKPLASSRLYETAPVGGPDGQGRFLNTVRRAWRGCRRGRVRKAIGSSWDIPSIVGRICP